MTQIVNQEFSVVLEIRDPDGDVCDNGEADVPCVISIDTYPIGAEDAVLGGALTRTPSAGVLTFNGLTIDTEGEGYKLKVQPVTPIDDFPEGTGSLASILSSAFNVYEYYLEIGATVADVVIYDEFISEYGSIPLQGFNLTVKILSGVDVYAFSNQSAIDFSGSWGVTPTFTLLNDGNIVGKGGDGGDGAGVVLGVGVSPAVEVGGSGTDAIELGGYDISIENVGNIWAGGGGGGGGGAYQPGSPGSTRGFGGGGGGRGTGYISGGVGLYTGSAMSGGGWSGSDGADGSGSSGGVGASGVPAAGTAAGGTGGDGATYGAAGSAGATATADAAADAAWLGTGKNAGGAGGAAGKAVSLSGGSVTWISGNNGAQVKGAVS